MASTLSYLKNLNRFFILLVLLFIAGKSYGQSTSFEGKNFYVTFMPNYTTSSVVYQVGLLSKVNTNVTLKNTSKAFSTSISLTANTPATVNIPATAGLHTNNEVIDSFAVRITADDNITVYSMTTFSTGFSSEATLVLPDQLLSTEYFATAFNGSVAPATLMIIATQDNTQVEITPTVTTSGGKPAGTPFTITMRKGNTYKLSGASTSTFNNDLSGTRVRVLNECKPVAVISGTTMSSVPTTSCFSFNPLIEQLVPVNRWGKIHLLAPYAGSGYNPASKPNALAEYSYRVVAAANSTVVTANGSTVATLNMGESYMATAVTGPVCVKTSNPAMVVQYNEGSSCAGNVGDPAMMIVPPIEQITNSSYISTALNTGFTQHFVNISLRTTAKSTMKLNGSTIAPNFFKSFSSCSEYSYAIIPVSSGDVLLESDSGFVANMYGYGSFDAYSFIAASHFRNLNYDFTSTAVQCGLLNFNFKNTGDVANIVSSIWYFGDNTSTNGTNINKTYTGHGTYTIKNVVVYVDGPGCNNPDTLVKTIRTMPVPDAEFTIDKSIQCEKGNRFNFQDTSVYFSGTNKQLASWSIGDTMTMKDSVTFGLSFPGAGNYKIRLSIQSTDGCKDSSVKYITVNGQAKPDYLSKNPQCFNEHVFKPQQTSKITGSYITGYRWDFGDGSFDTAAYPVKYYSKADSFDVRLIAYAANGCNDTITRKFTVNPSPKADFTVADKCFKDTAVTVNNSSISQGTNFYTWYFGDGKSDTGATVRKVYPDTGTYMLKLRATTDKGCQDSITKPYHSLPRPVVDFVSAGSCTDNAISFTNATNTYGATVSSFNWKYGDGHSSSAAAGSNIYGTHGPFLVKLITLLSNGCIDSVEKPIYVNPRPKADFFIDDSVQCFNGNTFSFFNNSNLVEGRVKQYTWFIDDIFWSNKVSEKRSFVTQGDYDIKLVVSSDSGCYDSLSRTAHVYPEVYLDISVNDTAQCYNLQSFEFVNNSSISGGKFGVFEWRFSNGDVDTAFYPKPKIFTNAGKYLLVVYAESDQGCFNSDTFTLSVYHAPSVDFLVKESCAGDSSYFDNLSVVPSGNIAHWLWDFGDGGKSAAYKPFYTYSTPGKYTVKLKGYTDQGCADSISKDTVALVKPSPVAYFVPEYLESLGQFTRYKFNNFSSGADHYFWNFDNSIYSREKEPEESFGDTGWFHIYLSVENNVGCFNAYDTVIYITPELQFYIPTAFTPNKDNTNSVFRIEGVFYVDEYEMHIFDRWGQQVFYSNHPDRAWDGKMGDEAMADGLYLYTIRVMDLDHKIHIIKGTVLLLK